MKAYTDTNFYPVCPPCRTCDSHSTEYFTLQPRMLPGEVAVRCSSCHAEWLWHPVVSPVEGWLRLKPLFGHETTRKAEGNGQGNT